MHNRKLLVGTLLSVLVCFVTAFVIGGLITIKNSLYASSPVETTLRHIEKLAQVRQESIQNFKVYSSIPFKDGQVILSSHTINSTSNIPITSFSFTFVKQGLLGWYVETGQSTGLSPLPELVIYGSSNIEDTGLIYGHILSSQVSEVEIVLDNNQKLQSRAVQGSFILFFPGTRNFTALNVKDANNRILETYTKPSSLEEENGN